MLSLAELGRRFVTSGPGHEEQLIKAIKSDLETVMRVLINMQICLKLQYEQFQI